jgi:hypothetical protein
MPEGRNIFSIGRRSGAEDQLTEMLVWLTSAVSDVSAAVVRLGLGDVESDIAQVQAYTQHEIAKGRLDAIFVSETVILVVESKLQSSYGDGQLRKYLDWLAQVHPDCPHRALMTLTAREAPWPAEDVARAAELGVVASPRRWQDLFAALASLAPEPGPDSLPARLVQEFLGMLSEEGLIPVKPLQADELLEMWSRGAAIIRRYHDFHRACRDAIADALHAQPHSNRSSAHATYIYQDFETAAGERICVGFNYTDREFPLTPKVYRDVPVVFLAIAAEDWPGWDSAVARLEENAPDKWRLNPNRWWGRPQVWRYLGDIVGDGTFEEQRERLAEACSEA